MSSESQVKFKINTLKEAKQAAFNGAVRGLAFQGWKQCVTENNTCKWNVGKPGFHCALGWLIPWDKQKFMSNGGVSEAVKTLSPILRDWHAAAKNPEKWKFEIFLQDMLVRHDQANNLSNKGLMSENFFLLGKLNDLVWPSDVPVPTKGESK